ncbi:SIS domain-containing protein [Methanopyrus sp. SNP6]|uniref:SIS domain-containing protein n=1 Tax=Methanopyrus sp. SNP6 TaxID=1937005 RepID=UPI0011E592B0|nr:SIS domain-containing protein [Methanopyrus sp. SNP6]
MSEHMRDDVERTPDDLRAVLALRFEDLPKLSSYRFILTTGSGSSHHVAHYASLLFTHELNIATVSHPGRLAAWADGADLAVVVSMSGGKDSHSIARALGCEILAVTCEENSPLADLADYLLLLPTEREEGFLNTRTIVSAMFALCAYASELSNEDLVDPDVPDRVERHLKRGVPEDIILEMRNREKVFFIGDKYLYVAAEQAALKSIEVGDANAFATTSDELFHGRFFGDHSERLYLCLNEKGADLIEERSGGETTVVRPDDLGLDVDPDDPNAPVETLPTLYLLVDEAYGPVDTTEARSWWNHV